MRCITRCSQWPCCTSRMEGLSGPHYCPQKQTAAPVICLDLKYTHTQRITLLSSWLWQQQHVLKVMHWPSGRKESWLAAIDSWLRCLSQHSWRGMCLSRLWSTVRVCREAQLDSWCGSDLSWFIDTSRVSSSCKSPISESFRGNSHVW